MKDENKKVDKVVKEMVDVKYNDEEKTRIREIAFIIFTFIFVGLEFLFYNLTFKGSDFIVQLWMGAATGCFVVALQETAKHEEYKIRRKMMEQMKNDENIEQYENADQ